MFKQAKRALLVILVTMSFLSITCMAQDDLPDLLRREGKLISEGKNTTPTGKLKVLTYRLETLKLAKPLNSSSPQSPLDSVFRITILTNGPQLNGNYNLRVDESLYDIYQIQPGKFVTIIYGKTLPNDLPLELSRRDTGNMVDESILPERLQVPAEYTLDVSDLEKQQRSNIVIAHRSGKFPRVELRFVAAQCVVINNILVLEIDGKEFPLGCDGGDLTGTFTEKEFARLKDGSRMIVKFGFGKYGGSRTVVGRLDKSSVKQL